MSFTNLTIAQSILRLVDPHECTDVKEARSIHEAIFDALVRRDHFLNYHPWLARSWTVSEDARIWTFTLEEGVRFHNGELFDAQSVKFSIERMTQPGIGAALGASGVYAQYLKGVEITIEAPYRVRVETPQPMADLLDILIDAYMLPPEEAKRAGVNLKDNPVGTGAYRLREWVPGERIVAEANEDYFRGAPAIKTVTWQLVEDRQSRIDMLLSGQAQIVTDLKPVDEEQIESDKTTRLLKTRNTTSITYFLNCNEGAFADQRVRQALNMAVDKQQLVDRILDGAGYPLSSFVGSCHLGYDPGVAPYEYNPEKAKALLAEAGHAGGLHLEMIAPTSFPAEAEVLSQEIAGQLKEVGIETKIHIIQDRTEYANMVRRKEIRDLCCFDSSPLSTYRVLKEKISSDFKGAWWQGYSNAEVNALISQGSRTADVAERTEIYQRCYRIVHDEAPWLFLYDPQFIFGYHESLEGWQPRADGCIIVRDME